MSKINNIIVEEISDEEHEVWQYEHSVDIADNFLDSTLLPLLDEFETNNEDSDYIDGAATHGLFAELVMRLGSMGYTEKDLKKEIKIYLNTSFGEILH